MIRYATSTEVESIRIGRYDDAARRMEACGVRLTWAQADEIGDVGDGWLRGRLGLHSETDADGATYAPEEL